MALPVFQAAGTGSETAPAWPAHQAGDLGLLFVEAGGGTVATPAGWNIIPGFPVVQAATVLSGFSRIATSGAEGAPALSGGTDHMWGVVVTCRGTGQNTPFHTFAGMVSTAATTTPSFAQAFTKVANCLIVNVLAWTLDNAGPILSAPVNASLGSVTEQYDAGTVTANGGGLGIITGTLAVAGNTGQTSCTATSTTYAAATIAITDTAGETGGGGASGGNMGAMIGPRIGT